MDCPACGQENPAGASFCEECGVRLERTCPACGAEVSPTAKFCRSCGGPLAAAPASASTSARREASPDSYTPKHLAERILASRGALEGERKQVTVLFADVKGSMELLAGRDPEEARTILDPVLERMMDAVHRYEGTVNQVMGDGIMALFGAPIAHEDHAVRACYAALAMQALVQEYAADVRRTTGLPVQIRVGLNSGEVVVRSIGSDLHVDYTAVGETTHLAARMEQMAVPGSILLAPPTMLLSEGYVQLKSLGRLPVQGLAEPMDVFEVLGVSPARSRLQAMGARGLTRFVGRDNELDTLRQSLERSASGKGQIVALVGEPGVGKSRLAWEFTHSHRADGWLVLESRSVSYGKANPYLPVIDFLRGYCGIEDRDDHRRIREKVLGKVVGLDPGLRSFMPALLALLDVPVEDPGWQRLDPPGRRQRTLDAVKRLLLRESQVQPVLLLCEDLHWIDSETQALLDGLVDSLPTARMLVLASYRPEYEHRWGSKTYYSQLRLDPLPPESADALLDALLGEDPGLDPLKRLLIQRTEGNPFFMEESVRTLLEAGALSGEPGAYRATRPPSEIHVPPTVQAVLAARIDRLPVEEKRLLQCAAVIGKDVRYALLRAIAADEFGTDGSMARVSPHLGKPSGDLEIALQQRLADLQAGEFLYEASLFPDLEYTFKHALTHDVAYGSLLQERRRALHARIVEAIEDLYVDRLPEQVEELAHHAVRGEQWAKAVDYLHQAATRAEARAALSEAVGYYEQALVALEHLPRDRAVMERAVDLRLGVRIPLYGLADVDGIFRHLQAAEEVAEALGDAQRLGWILTYGANHAWLTGDNARALEFGHRAVATPSRELPLQLESNYRLAQVYLTQGDYRRALDLFEANIAALTGGRERERFGLTGGPAPMAHGWAANCLAELGELGPALVHAEEAARLAEASDHAWTLIGTLGQVGFAYLFKGEVERATSILERCMVVGRARELTLLLIWMAAPLGRAYTLAGRLDDALAVLEEGVRDSAARFRAGYSTTLTALGETQLMTGRLHDAAHAGRQSLEYARAHGERGYEAYALRLLGEAALRTDAPEAEAYYHQALAVAGELGMRPLAAHCHAGLARAYERLGAPGPAQAERAVAEEMYGAMDLSFWLGRLE